jgi:type II secretory pathway component HofQ
VRVSRGAGQPDGGKSIAEPSGKTFSGRKIDLDFKEAAIRNLMRLFSDVGKVTITVDDEVQASITIRLRNVPWDEALDLRKRYQVMGSGPARSIAPSATRSPAGSASAGPVSSRGYGLT